MNIYIYYKKQYIILYIHIILYEIYPKPNKQIKFKKRNTQFSRALDG